MAARLNIKDSVAVWIEKINAVLDLQNVDGAFVNNDTRWTNTTFVLSGGKVRSGTNVLTIPGGELNLPTVSEVVVGVDVLGTSLTYHPSDSLPATDFIPLYVIQTNNERIVSVDDVRTWAYEDSGAAADAVSNHEGKADPHTQYYKDGDSIDAGVVDTATGTQTVSTALNQRVIYVDTIADLQALPTGGLIDGQSINCTSYHPLGYDSSGFYGGGGFHWDSDCPKTGHDGGGVISPTVPWDGLQTSLEEFLDGVGETDPDGLGCFVRENIEEVYVEDFGAVADGSTDDYPSINAAVNRTIRNVPGVGIFAGKVKFRDASYFCGQTLNLKRIVHIEGKYANNSHPRSMQLAFPEDTYGIIVHRHNTFLDHTTPPGESTGAADTSVISGIYLRSTGTSTDTTKAGIWLRARAAVRDVKIEGFGGNGFQVIATAGSGDPSREGNANNWSASNMRITDCGKNGFYTDGADANAGLGQAIDCSSNGEFGINDSSFLGNTYVGCHTASNTASYAAMNANARAIFVGCYTEGGQGPSEIWGRSMAVGGFFGGVVGTGFTIDGGSSSGTLRSFRVRQKPNSSRNFETYTSRRSDEAISLVAEGDDPAGINLGIWNESNGCWDIAHARTNVAFKLTTNLNTVSGGRSNPIDPGNAIYPTGYYLGGQGQFSRRVLATGEPSSGTWFRGDVAYNNNPGAGGTPGWICTTSGEAGSTAVFKSMANISA